MHSMPHRRLAPEHGRLAFHHAPLLTLCAPLPAAAAIRAASTNTAHIVLDRPRMHRCRTVD